MPSCLVSPRSRRSLPARPAARRSPDAGEHRVERLLVLAGVVVGAGERREREGVGLEEVAAADLGRVHADLVGGHVEDPLDELRRLRPAGAAVGADRWCCSSIAVDGVEAHLGDVVHADRHHLREHRQDRADRRVGARRTATTLASRPTILPSCVDAELGRHHEVAAVDERHHVLGAGLGPLHRTAERRARPRRRRGARRTPPPSGRSRRRPTGTRRAASRARGRASARTRRGSSAAPGATPSSVRPPSGSPGTATMPLRLHRHAGEALAHHRDLGDRRRRPRAGRRPRRRSVPKQTFEPCSGNSSGASGASARRRRVTDGQRVVVDDHRLGRVGGLRLGLGHDRGDDVADEAHLVRGEDRAVERRRHHREPLERRQAEVVAARRGTRRRRRASTRPR